MKSLRVSLAITLFLCLIISSANSQDAKDSVKTVKNDSSQSNFKLPSNFEMRFGWSKKSFNSTNIFKDAGNNFFSAEFGNRFQLSDDIGFLINSEYHFGNIFGVYAASVRVIPKLCIGDKNGVETFAGVGASVLLTFGDPITKYGGTGLVSEIGITYHIYDKYGFYLKMGYESYGSKNYQTYGIGISVSY